MDKLQDIVILLSKNEKLPAKNRDHKLVENFKDRRECHIEPNWLLIYKMDDEFLILERTGSHTDLF